MSTFLQSGDQLVSRLIHCVTPNQGPIRDDDYVIIDPPVYVYKELVGDFTPWTLPHTGCLGEKDATFSGPSGDWMRKVESQFRGVIRSGFDYVKLNAVMDGIDDETQTSGTAGIECAVIPRVMIFADAPYSNLGMYGFQDEETAEESGEDEEDEGDESANEGGEEEEEEEYDKSAYYKTLTISGSSDWSPSECMQFKWSYSGSISYEWNDTHDYWTKDIENHSLTRTISWRRAPGSEDNESCDNDAELPEGGDYLYSPIMASLFEKDDDLNDDFSGVDPTMLGEGMTATLSSPFTRAEHERGRIKEVDDKYADDPGSASGLAMFRPQMQKKSRIIRDLSTLTNLGSPTHLNAESMAKAWARVALLGLDAGTYKITGWMFQRTSEKDVQTNVYTKGNWTKQQAFQTEVIVTDPYQMTWSSKVPVSGFVAGFEYHFGRVPAWEKELDYEVIPSSPSYNTSGYAIPFKVEKIS